MIIESLLRTKNLRLHLRWFFAELCNFIYLFQLIEYMYSYCKITIIIMEQVQPGSNQHLQLPTHIVMHCNVRLLS